jgi:hypothetical protein
MDTLRQRIGDRCVDAAPSSTLLLMPCTVHVKKTFTYSGAAESLSTGWDMFTSLRAVYIPQPLQEIVSEHGRAIGLGCTDSRVMSRGEQVPVDS